MEEGDIQEETPYQKRVRELQKKRQKEKDDLEQEVAKSLTKRLFPTPAEKVRLFTQAANLPTPSHPTPLSGPQVYFLVQMLLDEILELTSTVSDAEQSKHMIKMLLDDAKELPYLGADLSDPDGVVKICAEQADALVDLNYYCLDVAARHGINLSTIFDLVHEANMKKADPSTGKFLKREDGKILKPAGWQPPSIETEIRRQMFVGSFPS